MDKIDCSRETVKKFNFWQLLVILTGKFSQKPYSIIVIVGYNRGRAESFFLIVNFFAFVNTRGPC
jgi:hypothetical protein